MTEWNWIPAEIKSRPGTAWFKAKYQGTRSENNTSCLTWSEKRAEPYESEGHLGPDVLNMILPSHKY
jgi:protein involved in temperature-dependent protein secretion